MAIKLRDRKLLAELAAAARFRGVNPEALIDILVASEMARTFGEEPSRHLRRVRVEYKRMLRSAGYSASDKVNVRRTLRSLQGRDRTPDILPA